MEAEKYLVRTRALRSQRDVWKQAAVGVLALSITGNIGLYGIACSREARHREETAQLRTELRHVEAVRDDALEELGRMANDYALEAKARREDRRPEYTRSDMARALEGSEFAGLTGAVEDKLGKIIKSAKRYMSDVGYHLGDDYDSNIIIELIYNLSPLTDECSLVAMADYLGIE